MGSGNSYYNDIRFVADAFPAIIYSDSATKCTFTFNEGCRCTRSKHNCGGDKDSAVVLTVPLTISRLTVRVDNTSTFMRCDNLRKVYGPIISYDGRVALDVKTRSSPWQFTFYDERRRIKLINRSTQVVYIQPKNDDDLVVVNPGRRRELNRFRDVLTHKMRPVWIKSCYRAVGGRVERNTGYRHDRLEFDCVDQGDLVVVLVTEGY
jgi:hypothetical protein